MAFNFLIVDDERLSRNYIRNMIKGAQSDAIIFDASNVTEALDIFRREPIDIIFLDIKMPEVDGFGLLSLLPHRNFELVFITAYNQHAIKAIKEGAVDYLLKPIKKAEFTTTLANVINKRKQSQKIAGGSGFLEKLSEVEMQLAAYIQNVKEKSELIEQLQEEIVQLRAVSTITDEKTATLDALQNSAILTEDDWNNFKENFEHAYPHFFFHLRTKYPNLTQADIRLMALIKLNMTTKEMAHMLGISPETIRQTRWRIRKKMELPDEISLEQIALSF